MVMGRDSHSKGRGFESRHRILDGHFFTYCCKNCYVCLKRPKLNEKEAGVGPFFLINNEHSSNDTVHFLHQQSRIFRIILF